MKTMTKLMMMAVLVISILFPSGLVANAETPVKSGYDLYELNVLAKKIEPICKKYGYVARNSAEGFEYATCVDADDNKMVQDITPIFIGVDNDTKSIAFAIDLIVQIGSNKDTKAELLSIVTKAIKKPDTGVRGKGGTLVTYRSKIKEVHFMNYKSFGVETKPITDPFKLNTLAKKIETTCKKYGFRAMNVSDSATCVDKKNNKMVEMDNGTIYSTPQIFNKKYELAVDIAYLLGKKDTKADLLKTVKLATKSPHKFIKTKNGTPIVSDKGGRVSIPFTKAKINEINKIIKK